MFRISLQILILIWWIGAAIALVLFYFDLYQLYVIVGSMGWIIVLTTTALIIYEIRKIKEEDKRKELAEK